MLPTCQTGPTRMTPMPNTRRRVWYTVSHLFWLEVWMSLALSPSLEVGENITKLVPYRPGKPIDEVKRELGLTDVIKLASNENSLGPSPLALDAMREAATKVHLYPDAGCFELRNAVSRHLGIPDDHLIFGNGSDDI